MPLCCLLLLLCQLKTSNLWSITCPVDSDPTLTPTPHTPSTPEIFYKCGPKGMMLAEIGTSFPFSWAYRNPTIFNQHVRQPTHDLAPRRAGATLRIHSIINTGEKKT